MATITKRELIKRISDNTGLTQTKTSEVIHEAFHQIVTELAQANTVVIRNFGSFDVVEAKAKIGRNPLNPGKPVPIPARAVAKFKPGKKMKERVARVLPMVRKAAAKK